MTNPTLHLPWPTLVILLGLLVACFWLALAAVRKMASALESQPDGMLPLIDSNELSSSVLHSWDPRFKIVAIITFAFLVVSLKQAAFVGAALVTAVMIIGLGRLSWDRSLPLNLRGLQLALVIIGKAWTVALLMEPLLATAPLGTTLEGLTRLGVPARVGELLLISHRYIHVFFGELQRMRNGMEARAFRADYRCDRLKDYGNFVGMLLVRSFERTHRVYDAMLARGYAGTMPGQYDFKGKPSDWLKTILLVVIGFGLLLADRFAGGA
jgi:cobalt/nickel transport system permease protein